MNGWLLFCALGNLAFLAFHLSFWHVFGWRQELVKLQRTNRAIMQILNLRLSYVFGLFAFLQFAFPAEILATPLGRALQFGMAIFWAMRAGEQIVFFGLRHPASLAIFGAFCALTVGHLVPLFPN